jgi:hypothetical protein
MSNTAILAVSSRRRLACTLRQICGQDDRATDQAGSLSYAKSAISNHKSAIQ